MTSSFSWKNLLLETFINLRTYLIETKTWLSFKLIIAGTPAFYLGLYINNSYVELSGLLLIGVGIWKIPFVQAFIKDAFKE